MKKVNIALFLAGFSIFSGCRNNTENVSPVDTQLNAQVITNFSLNVASAEYTGLAAQTSLLYDNASKLSTDRSDANLAACIQNWKDARKIWEQSEAQLFGPVETENIDPHIDTWPVDFNALDAELNGSDTFTVDYINSLDDALKGFHPIEYILFGKDGQKTASQLTDRELEYLAALALNVKTLTANLNSIWDSNSPTSFYASFETAGNGSTVYTSQQSALAQLVNAMIDICDEVANSKMKGPYDAQDPTLEESPFSKNSMIDFTNNITGIQDVYLGKYQTGSPGLESIVKAYNLSLDSDIKTKLGAALTAMNNISLPFGEAIISQHVQVQNAMSAINDLKSELEDNLLPFVKEHSK